jgi:hypothetical protein
MREKKDNLYIVDQSQEYPLASRSRKEISDQLFSPPAAVTGVR